MAETKEVKREVKNVQTIDGTSIEKYDIFQILKHNDKYMVAITNKIISSKVFDTKEAAEAYIDGKPWELIINAAVGVFDILSENK